jgi:hypothetical protein
LKKSTRNRNPNDDDNEDEITPKAQEISGNFSAKKTTNEVSTQTCNEGEPQQEENYLLALRDRLLASKTDKRENPYSNLITHEATRYPENLKEYPQHQMANSGLSSYISLQGNPGPQNISGIQAQYYQQQPSNMNQLGRSINQNLILNMGHPQTGWNNMTNAQQQSGNNFSSMSYTGPNQAQYTVNQANDNQKGQVKYVQPVLYVMPPSVNQLNFSSPIYQNIQNYPPHTNTYLHYGQNQKPGQNQNLKRG